MQHKQVLREIHMCQDMYIEKILGVLGTVDCGLQPTAHSFVCYFFLRAVALGTNWCGTRYSAVGVYSLE